MSDAMKTVGHEACFVCQGRFCFSAVRDCGSGVETELVFASEHEGWRGIPHGGVAMTALLDLADHCCLRIRGMNLMYPLAIEWRFADSVAIGDKMHLTALAQDDGTIDLQMRRVGSEKIYLRGKLRHETGPEKVDFRLPDPRELLQGGSKHQPLEVYENCFVCGRQRRLPGLRRRFFKTVINPEVPDNRDFSAIIVHFGAAGADADLRASLQQALNRLHPGVLAALLDELCGWSGVLADNLYGYTVRFKLNINCLPEIGAEFFGFSPRPQVRGRGARKFYHPQGALYRKRADGSLEIIASAGGQWLARDELRRQFDESHIVEDLRGIVF